MPTKVFEEIVSTNQKIKFSRISVIALRKGEYTPSKIFPRLRSLYAQAHSLSQRWSCDYGFERAYSKMKIIYQINRKFKQMHKFDVIFYTELCFFRHKFDIKSLKLIKCQNARQVFDLKLLRSNCEIPIAAEYRCRRAFSVSLRVEAQRCASSSVIRPT